MLIYERSEINDTRHRCSSGSATHNRVSYEDMRNLCEKNGWDENRGITCPETGETAFFHKGAPHNAGGVGEAMPL